MKNSGEKTTEAEERALRATEEEVENQKGRVLQAIKAEKEARKESIRIQGKINEIRHQRREEEEESSICSK